MLFELLPDGLTRVTTTRACSALYAVLGLWCKNNNTVSIHVDCNKAKLARSNQAKATLAKGDRSSASKRGARPGHWEKPIFRANISKEYTEDSREQIENTDRVLGALRACAPWAVGDCRNPESVRDGSSLDGAHPAH